MGAFYSILGSASVVRVAAIQRERCNDCMDCTEICPEPQVLKLPLYGAERGAGPTSLSPNCTNCGRCIDVCAQDVFQFGTRFRSRAEPHMYFAKETQS